MKWTRSRTASALALGAASALLLSACTPGTGNGEGNGDKPDLTLKVADFGNWYTPEMMAEYEAANPHITIDWVSGDFSAHHTGLQTQLIAGSGAAHVVGVETGFMAGFLAQSDNFVNLLDLGAGKYKDNFPDWKWAEAASADGETVIGLGSDIGGLAMCYRRDLFEAAGLPVESADVDAFIDDSWDNFITLGEQYVAATGKGFVDNVGNIHHPNMTQGGVGYYNRNNELNMEPTKPAFDLALRVMDSGLSADIGSWSGEWNTGFENGDFAVIACPSWMLSYIRNQVSADTFDGAWDIADIPGPGGNWGGSFYTIPSMHSDYEIQEAYAFIEWVLAPEQQITIFEEHGNLTAQTSLYDRPEIADYVDPFFNNAPAGQVFTTSVRDIPAPIYYAPKHQLIANVVGAILGEVQAGNISAADAWNRAVAIAEETDAA